MDIRRVLDRMQVQYHETKTGFECIHIPSIDLSSVPESAQKTAFHAPTPIHRKQGSSGSHESGTHRKSMARKASMLSFGKSRKEREQTKEREKDRDVGSQHDKELPGRPSGGTAITTTASSGSSSFFNVSNTHTITAAVQDDTLSTVHAEETPRPHSASSKSKTLPPIPRDLSSVPHPGPLLPLPTGEVDREVFETIGANTLSVRFEVNIVKVPWLPLHGIQFRRASGDGWQYQMLARRVLTELKL